MQEFLRRLALKAGRALPPLARLHHPRNDALAKVAVLRGEKDERETDRKALLGKTTALERELSLKIREVDELRTENMQLRADHDYVLRRKSEGHLIELDYACTPKVREWKDASGFNHYANLIASDAELYREWLKLCALHVDYFAAISVTEPEDERQPYWNNPWFPPLDAICLSGILAKTNPRRYVEVGSGNSTKFVRRAINDHGLRTRIISIDPHPRAEIDAVCDEVIRQSLENVNLALFSDLGDEDVLFIDNSHRSFQNSDVTVFFTEIIPKLQSGCIYGIHDIFLPNDYPKDWSARYYNEQYLLMAYLLGGAGGDKIIMPVHFVLKNPDLVSIVQPIANHPSLDGITLGGGAFWLRKA